MLYANKKTPSQLRKTSQGYKYSSKEYSNPFFTKKKKKKTVKSFYFFISWKIKLLIASFFLLFAGAAAVVIFLPYFQIFDFQLEGKGNIDQQHIRWIIESHLDKKKLEVFKNRNIFLFNSQQLIDELNNKYVFQEIQVNKKLPSSLKVSYIEEKYAIIYEEGEVFYYSDDEGNIIEEVDVLEVNQKEYPILKNLSDDIIKENELTIDKSLVVYAINAYNKFFKQRTEDLSIEYFQINQDDGNKLWLKIKDGPFVYLNVKTEFSDQLKRLLILKEQKLESTFFDKEYIDLRYGESIYFR